MNEPCRCVPGVQRQARIPFPSIPGEKAGVKKKINNYIYIIKIKPEATGRTRLSNSYANTCKIISTDCIGIFYFLSGCYHYLLYYYSLLTNNFTITITITITIHYRSITITITITITIITIATHHYITIARYLPHYHCRVESNTPTAQTYIP